MAALALQIETSEADGERESQRAVVGGGQPGSASPMTLMAPPGSTPAMRADLPLSVLDVGYQAVERRKALSAGKTASRK